MMHVPSPQPPRRRPMRGGAPVGVLSELPPVELAAILYLRHWFSGNKDLVWRDFANSFDRVDAAHAMASFKNLMRAVQDNARRPLMRHSPTCDCFGGDECAFAQFIAAAASGDDHDAMTFALHLFDGVQAQCAMRAAAMCGLAFFNMAAGHVKGPIQTHPTPPQKQ